MILGSQCRDYQPIVATKACNKNSSGYGLQRAGQYPSSSWRVRRTGLRGGWVTSGPLPVSLCPPAGPMFQRFHGLLKYQQQLAPGVQTVI